VGPWAILPNTTDFSVDYGISCIGTPMSNLTLYQEREREREEEDRGERGETEEKNREERGEEPWAILPNTTDFSVDYGISCIGTPVSNLTLYL
jgi:hypothetical protein